jgi:ABC-type Mn2+/Zn2+ transport system permease subunit
MREDASFAAAYLTAMALGVLIVSLRGSAVDLMNILFGAILAVDDAALILVLSTATLTLVGLAAIYRPLVVECFNRASSPPWASGLALSLSLPGARRPQHGGGLRRSAP